MNKIAAAEEIEATARNMGAGETISLLRIWNEIGGAAVMSWTDFSEGVKHLARNVDGVLLSTALYPWEYTQAELNKTVWYGGKERNTLLVG